MTKPSLADVTLVAIDTTDKAHLAERAIERSLGECNFADVKLLTHNTSLRHAVKIRKLSGRADYSTFVLGELENYIKTSHFLIVQWDGYVTNSDAWSREYLKCDYLGPYLGDHNGHEVYNGGFSLRSKRLFGAVRQVCGGTPKFDENGMMEDMLLCIQKRAALQSLGCRIGDRRMAHQFAVDGSSVNSGPMNGEFGFHSYCTVLPDHADGPLIFHHSGDSGDVIYGLATVAALGGGDIFFSAYNRFSYPGPTRAQMTNDWPNWTANLAPLLYQQDYVWNVHHHYRMPNSTHCDLNEFRKAYIWPARDNWKSLFQLHLEAFGANWPEDKPWLTVDYPVSVPGRPIVVNKTDRYENHKFPWYELVRKYGDRMVFVGSDQEYERFYGFGMPEVKVPRYPTTNLLDVARLIAGCKVFIGNQSCPMAIALGLGANVIQEVWLGNANCMLNRKNAIYVKDDKANIPAAWLK